MADTRRARECDLRVTIYTWRRQARIDAGLEAGVTTSEQAELAAAKRRIRELETELAAIIVRGGGPEPGLGHPGERPQVSEHLREIDGLICCQNRTSVLCADKAMKAAGVSKNGWVGRESAVGG